MVINRFPTVGSGRIAEGGQLATTKQDFLSHVQGNAYHHTADVIEMNPSISGGTTVQQTLEQIQSLVTASGSGFISIGNTNSDGYSTGSYNVGGTDTPTLATAFAAAIADKRLTDGGIILLMAGTYTTTTTIQIPAGISVIGELEGTIIVAEMTEQPMFQILNGTRNINIGGNSGSGAISIAIGSDVDSVRFANLILADNLNSNVAGGGPSMSTVPMVQMKTSANFSCDKVTFIGRLANGAVAARSKTFAAIGTTSGGGTGTYLSVKDCFIDGTKLGISYTPNNGNIDFLIVSQSKIRFYGTESSSSVSKALNSFIVSSLCNAIISNNYVVGVGSQANTFWEINSSGGNTGVVVSVIGNTGAPFNGTGTLLNNDTAVTLTSVTTANKWGLATNNVDSESITSNTGTIDVNSILNVKTGMKSTTGHIDVTSIFNLQNGLDLNVTNVNGTYSVSTNEIVLLVDTVTNAPAIISLPDESRARMLIIKDIAGGAHANPIQLVPHNLKKIDGIATTTQLLSTNYGSWTYISDGSNNWWSC